LQGTTVAQKNSSSYTSIQLTWSS